MVTDDRGSKIEVGWEGRASFLNWILSEGMLVQILYRARFVTTSFILSLVLGVTQVWQIWVKIFERHALGKGEKFEDISEA